MDDDVLGVQSSCTSLQRLFTSFCMMSKMNLELKILKWHYTFSVIQFSIIKGCSLARFFESTIPKARAVGSSKIWIGRLEDSWIHAFMQIYVYPITCKSNYRMHATISLSWFIAAVYAGMSTVSVVWLLFWKLEQNKLVYLATATINSKFLLPYSRHY